MLSSIEKFSCFYTPKKKIFVKAIRKWLYVNLSIDSFLIVESLRKINILKKLLFKWSVNLIQHNCLLYNSILYCRWQNTILINALFHLLLTSLQIFLYLVLFKSSIQLFNFHQRTIFLIFNVQRPKLIKLRLSWNQFMTFHMDVSTKKIINICVRLKASDLLQSCLNCIVR